MLSLSVAAQTMWTDSVKIYFKPRLFHLKIALHIKNSIIL